MEWEIACGSVIKLNGFYGSLFKVANLKELPWKPAQVYN